MDAPHWVTRGSPGIRYQMPTDWGLDSGADVSRYGVCAQDNIAPGSVQVPRSTPDLAVLFWPLDLPNGGTIGVVVSAPTTGIAYVVYASVRATGRPVSDICEPWR